MATNKNLFTIINSVQRPRSWSTMSRKALMTFGTEFTGHHTYMRSCKRFAQNPGKYLLIRPDFVIHLVWLLHLCQTFTRFLQSVVFFYWDPRCLEQSNTPHAHTLSAPKAMLQCLYFMDAQCFRHTHEEKIIPLKRNFRQVQFYC